MKRIFLNFFIVVCVMQAGFAQAVLRPYIGFNSSSIDKDLTSEAAFKSRVGFQIGVDFQFGNAVYFQPGIQFEALRNSIQPSGTMSNLDEFDLNRSYLRVPLMIGYRFADSGSMFNFRLFTGPNAALRLSGKVGDEQGVLGGVNLKDRMRDLIFGWNVGVGLDFLSIFFLDLGYQIGLSDIFKDAQGLNTGARNNLYYGNAGLRMHF